MEDVTLVNQDVTYADLPKNSIWDRYVGRPFAETQLKRKLHKIVVTAKIHKENGLPRGHRYYGALLDEAESKIAKFCKDWDLTKDYCYQSMPTLPTLRMLAHPPVDQSRKTPGNFIAFVALVLIILPIVLGSWFGFFSAGQHWIHMLLGGM